MLNSNQGEKKRMVKVEALPIYSPLIKRKFIISIKIFRKVSINKFKI